MKEITTEGVVLKRTYTGEKNAILKILTRDAGLISASAKGIKNMNSKLAAGAGIFRFSEFVLKPSRQMYIVAQSTLKEGFFGLSSNIERLSYATYFADLACAFRLTFQDSKKVFPLMLNALHLLSNTDKNMRLVKCVFELRLLGATGFAPELSLCANCGFSDHLCFFSPRAGGTVCRSCGNIPDACIISEDTLSAMRYAQNADNKKAFSFALSQSAVTEFSRCTEAMCEYVLDRKLHALDYLNQITGKF